MLACFLFFFFSSSKPATLNPTQEMELKRLQLRWRREPPGSEPAPASQTQISRKVLIELLVAGDANRNTSGTIDQDDTIAKDWFPEMLTLEAGIVVRKVSPLLTRYSKDCYVCGQKHNTKSCGMLSHLQPIRWVRDTKTLSRARLTLPTNLEVQDNDGSTNVMSRVKVNKGTQFGPFQAPRSLHLPANSKFPLQVFEKSSKDVASSYYLDTSDEEQCNWMCLVAIANSPKSQNLICYQDQEEIMFIAMKDIQPNEHLLVYYAPYYAMKLGKTPFQMEVPTKVSWFASPCPKDTDISVCWQT
uniref:SET domain-containing protein n=1 Tax=Timema poppense TaxID=170557 RepID=A0A7R9D0X0_TIMPO|nr:unnamed protein product [Timema poppensis]